MAGKIKDHSFFRRKGTTKKRDTQEKLQKIQKKCKIIWSCQKKVVILRAILRKGQIKYNHRSV